MADKEPRVLVVADCTAVEKMTKELERHGFHVETVTTSAEATDVACVCDIVLIDLDLEDFDGLTLCKRLRSTSNVPMIGFSASHELDRVLALEGGCDDCISKPYLTRELMARMRALLRRTSARSQPLLVTGELEIDPNLREIRIGGQLVGVTRKEFELLHLLAAEPDKVFSRTELLRRVWDYGDVDAEVASLASRTIDTHLSSIRKKLGSPHWIVTIRGVGFRFGDGRDADGPGEDDRRDWSGESAG